MNASRTEGSLIFSKTSQSFQLPSILQTQKKVSLKVVELPEKKVSPTKKGFNTDMPFLDDGGSPVVVKKK